MDVDVDVVEECEVGGEEELSLPVGWMIVSVFLTPLIKTGEQSVIGLILLLTC